MKISHPECAGSPSPVRAAASKQKKKTKTKQKTKKVPSKTPAKKPNQTIAKVMKVTKGDIVVALEEKTKSK